VRRAVAVLGALSLALAAGPRTGATPRPLAEAARRLTPAMRAVIEGRGYPDRLLARAVRGHRPGTVYSLAKVSGRLDRRLLRDLERAGARVRVAFPETGWVALASSRDAALRVARLDRVRLLDVDRIQSVLDARVSYVQGPNGERWRPQTKRGTNDVGAELLWRAGITGTGVTVGVVDTGVDGTHPDLDDQDWGRWGTAGLPPKLVAFRDCTGTLPDFGPLATVQGREIRLPAPPTVCLDLPSYDDNGHGTHVSGIAVGSAEGGRPEQRGLLPGMAPTASLAVAKGLFGAGIGLSSAIMAGMVWLAMEREEGGAGADIINLSLGSGRVYGAPLFTAEQVVNEDNPEAELVNALARIHNALFVIAAGNSGPVLQSVGSPAVASQALTVGASVADFDLNHDVAETEHGQFGDVRPEAVRAGAIGIAGFSSRGPTGDRLVKPDVVAPGAYVVAAESEEGAETRAADAAVGNHYSRDLRYAVLSGTSMAAPSAAGAAALVIDGARRALGEMPPYYRVKAALVNTAGRDAFEGPVAGLIGSILAKLGVQPVEDRYPIRNEAWVGVSGVGAGRIDAVAALAALTRGVTALTPQQGDLDDIHELQPSWSMDDLPPGGSATTTFLLHGAPLMAGPARVTFAAEQVRTPRGVLAAPPGWFALPRGAVVRPGADTPVRFSLRIPADAAPGAYEAYLVASVRLGAVTQRIRIPVQFFVRVADPNPRKGGVTLEGPIWASDATDYSIVGFLDPLGDVHTDWTMIPLRLEAGTKRVDFTLYDPAGKDRLDLFVFDEHGQEVDSTVTPDPATWVPEGALYAPTDEKSPATVSILDRPEQSEPFLLDRVLSRLPGGGQGQQQQQEQPEANDFVQLTLPTTVWLAISRTGPAEPATFGTYRLRIDVTGGAVQPAAPSGGGGGSGGGGRAPGRALPATGVATPVAAPVTLLAGAAMVAWSLAPRRRRG
jgi:subtilisin family serine protease